MPTMLNSKRTSVPDFDLRQIKNSLITSRKEFLKAAGTMQVDVQLYDTMSLLGLACGEHFYLCFGRNPDPEQRSSCT